MNNSTLGIVLLAAGAGSRMGQIKPLAKWQDSTFVERLLSQVLALPFPVALILGAHSQQVEAAIEPNILTSPQLQRLTNEDWQQGMSSSIALGASHFKRCGAVMFIAVDQVLIQTAHIIKLIAKWQQNSLAIHCAGYQDTYGIPVIFPAQYFPKLLSLTGEKGAKSILAQSSATVFVDLPEAAIDIDTPQQLEHLTQTMPSISHDLSSTPLINKN
jgi:molybdenum cofactor cytidylyltransferase